MINSTDNGQRLSLREQVEQLLPSWESWYPSLFHAAEDLGVIRARVCAPSSLMLSHRHANVQNEAIQAFNEQWCVEEEPDPALPLRVPGKLRKRAPRPNYSGLPQRPPIRRR